MRFGDPVFDAKLALRLMDLTSLTDQDTEESVRLLAAKARTAYGIPAALCVYSAFVGVARAELNAQGIPEVKIATVSNFPGGEPSPETAADSTRLGVNAGADEIDTVLPYRAFLRGDSAVCRDTLRAVKQACAGKTLKVILETGELKEPALIRRAAELALEEGADFLKTSTGKSPVSATPEAAAALIEVLQQAPSGKGLKIAGGVKNLEDARVYMRLAADAFGEEFLTPATFRFGASGLLGSLLATLAGTAPARDSAGY